jgi:tRNA(Ile)-lysidine synthase TilS/MesJ
MAECGKCGSPAVTFIRHAGRHLCGEHFIDLTERRVQKAIRQQADLSGGGTMAVAVSGGKDSMACLDIMRRTLEPRRDSRIVAITVDEGIEGYRDSSIPIAREYCKEHGIEWVLTSIEEEQGVTMDRVASAGLAETPCAFCGVWRRWSMNRAAREAGARYLATGLNLDDTAQSVLMNVCRGDVERLARFGPHTREQPGLVPRIQPLRWIPEVESYLYAHLRGLPIHNAECPHLGRAQRGRYRRVLHELQEDEPGVAHALVRSLERMRPAP